MPVNVCACVLLSGHLPQGVAECVPATHKGWQQPRRDEEEGDKNQGVETVPLRRARGLRTKLGYEGVCAVSIL
jgi:hypothetical protein